VELQREKIGVGVKNFLVKRECGHLGYSKSVKTIHVWGCFMRCGVHGVL